MIVAPADTLLFRKSTAPPRRYSGFLARIFSSKGEAQGKEDLRHRWMDRRLEDCVFTVLDTELTGMNVRRDEIVSVGAVRIRNMGIAPAESFSTLVQPKLGPSRENTLIHGITNERLAEAPRLRIILPDLLDFIGDSILIGHNIGLDLSFLNAACNTVFQNPVENPSLDTLTLSMAYERELYSDGGMAACRVEPSYTLTDVANRFGLPIFAAHDAMEDALQTAYLFLYLIRKLRKGRLCTLAELNRVDRQPLITF